jgi:hypothetical protein
MSKILQIGDQLRDVHAEIARIERAVATHPQSKALSIDFRSMSKRRAALEAEFSALADRQDLDVLQYRLMPASSAPLSLRALTRILDKFQAAISTVYDSIKSGAKRRVKLSADVLVESGFDFGYTYSGSVGVVLTVPNERMLLDSSRLDLAVAAFFDVAESTSRAEVIEFARRYGIASVRRIYDWSAAHADYDIAADINLTRSAATRVRLQVAPKALRRLKHIIEETSDVVDESQTVTARLAGMDVDKRTFHLVALEDEDIEGKWADIFVHDSSHVLDKDKVFTAELSKQTRVHFALEREETAWFLKKATLVSK